MLRKPRRRAKRVFLSLVVSRFDKRPVVRMARNPCVPSRPSLPKTRTWCRTGPRGTTPARGTEGAESSAEAGATTRGGPCGRRGWPSGLGEHRARSVRRIGGPDSSGRRGARRDAVLPGQAGARHPVRQPERRQAGVGSAPRCRRRSIASSRAMPTPRAPGSSRWSTTTTCGTANNRICWMRLPRRMPRAQEPAARAEHRADGYAPDRAARAQGPGLHRAAAAADRRPRTLADVGRPALADRTVYDDKYMDYRTSWPKLAGLDAVVLRRRRKARESQLEA